MKHQRIVSLRCDERTCGLCRLLDRESDDGVALYFCGDTDRELRRDADGNPRRSRSCLAAERKAAERGR